MQPIACKDQHCFAGGYTMTHYIPDHEEPNNRHDTHEKTGGDHNHNRDRNRDEELKRVSDTRQQQKDKPRKSRGK